MNTESALSEAIAKTLIEDNRVPIIVCDSSAGSSGLTPLDWISMLVSYEQNGGTETVSKLTERTV